MSIMQYLFLLVLTNAGGEGKTMISLLLHALLTLAGKPTGFIDADQGNYSGAVQMHNWGEGESVKTVRWNLGRDRVSRIIADHEGRSAILDSGANMAAAHGELMQTMPHLLKSFVAKGYRAAAFLPVSTNKEGAVGAIVELAQEMEGFEPIFVRVNRDNSKSFEKGLDPSRTIDLGHLAPGFQSYVRHIGGGLASAVSTPPAGYEAAATHVAYWMLDFARQPLVQELLGSAIVAELERLVHDRKREIYRFSVTTPEATTNAALSDNALRTRRMTALDKGKWSAEAFRSIAGCIDSGDL